jgi:hypothetical protein
VRATAGELGGPSGQHLVAAADAAEQASDWLRTAWSKHQRDALAGATPYLRLLAVTVGGWLLARQALASRPRAGSDMFFAAKEVSARYFLEQVVPHATGLLPAITAGATDLDLLPAEVF